MKILEINNLSKIFAPKGYRLAKNLKIKGMEDSIAKKSIVALKDFSLEANEGEIIGLLGSNGAGKSTLIKLITGLISPDEGEVIVCGENVAKNRAKALENIGAVIEIPEMIKNITGMENLRYLAKIQGGVSDERIIAVAEMLGIADRLHTKVGTYSLGMKQRIGIVQAIMHSPKLLLLDEPTNGLDPQGIIDMRNIIKKLAKEMKMCVIVSSHILSEIQQLCEKIVILNKGVKVAENSVAELQSGSYACKNIVQIICDDVDKASEILKEKGFVDLSVDGAIIKFSGEEKDVPEITKTLVLAGVNIYSLNIKKPDLESIFTNISSDSPFDELSKGGEL